MSQYQPGNKFVFVLKLADDDDPVKSVRGQHGIYRECARERLLTRFAVPANVRIFVLYCSFS